MLPIHQISLPTPWPEPGPVHVYLVREDPVTLVDTGLNTPESRAALEEGLSRLGLTVREIRRILITHAHVDHMGQAAWLAAESGAEVLLHPEEAPKLQAPPWWRKTRDEILAGAGVNAVTMHRMDKAWRHGRKIAPPLLSWSPLHDGQRIPFASGELTAVHLPGHALGHMGFYEEASRRLIGGDHLLHRVTPNPILEPVRPEHPDAVPHDPTRALSLGQFVRSLARVHAMDVATVLPAHGPVIDDHRAVVAYYRQRLEQRMESYRPRLALGLTPWELTQEVYPWVKGMDLFLALSTVLAHLDLMVVRGMARFDREDEPCQGFRYLPA